MGMTVAKVRWPATQSCRVLRGALLAGLLAAATTGLLGCGEQPKPITKDQAAAITTGMSREQVEAALGSPGSGDAPDRQAFEGLPGTNRPGYRFWGTKETGWIAVGFDDSGDARDVILVNFPD